MTKLTINLFSIILLFVIQVSQAQEAGTTAAKFGVKGGVNFSNLYTKDVDDNNVLTGFNIGFFAKLPITSFLAIQPEVTYSTKGAELKYNNFFANGTAKSQLNYVEIPVLAVINLTNNFSLQAGP